MSGSCSGRNEPVAAVEEDSSFLSIPNELLSTYNMWYVEREILDSERRSNLQLEVRLRRVTLRYVDCNYALLKSIFT